MGLGGQRFHARPSTHFQERRDLPLPEVRRPPVGLEGLLVRVALVEQERPGVVDLPVDREFEASRLGSAGSAFVRSSRATVDSCPSLTTYRATTINMNLLRAPRFLRHGRHGTPSHRPYSPEGGKGRSRNFAHGGSAKCPTGPGRSGGPCTMRAEQLLGEGTWCFVSCWWWRSWWPSTGAGSPSRCPTPSSSRSRRKRRPPPSPRRLRERRRDASDGAGSPRLVLVREPDQLGVERAHPQPAFGGRLVELAVPHRHVAADDDRTPAGLDDDHLHAA